MRLVAPHNAPFQQTILYILYKYWDLSNICAGIAPAVAAIPTHTLTGLTLVARTLAHQYALIISYTTGLSSIYQSMTNLPTYPHRVTCVGSNQRKNNTRLFNSFMFRYS